MPSSNSGALGSANSAYRGLRSSEAAERLSHSLRGVLADDARRIELEEAREFGDVLFRQLTAVHNVIMITSSFCLFAGYAYGADAKASAMESSYLISGLVVIAGVVLNITLVLMRLHRLRWEIHYRMTDVLLEYERVALTGGAVVASAVYASATALAFAKAMEPEDQSVQPLSISSAQLLSATAASAGAVITDDGVVAGIMQSSWESLEFHEPINATHALPVFRDGDWIRLPVSLLVKGDLIALTTKEIPPAKFDERDGRLLGRRGSSLRSYLESPSALTTSSVTPKSNSATLQTSVQSTFTTTSATTPGLEATELKEFPTIDDVKMRIRENDIDAVTLVGDLRRYVLRDTVARAALQRRLRVQPKPQPLLMWELRSFSKLVNIWQTVLVAIAILAIVVRTIVTNCVPDGDLDNQKGASNCRNGGFIGLLAGFLYQIPALLLCLSPVSLPLILLIVEAYSTARVLAFHEAVLVRSKWKEWKKRLMLDIFYAQRKQSLENVNLQGKSSETNSSNSNSDGTSTHRSNEEFSKVNRDLISSPNVSRFLCCSCLRKLSLFWSQLLHSSPNNITNTDPDVKNPPLETSSEDDAASMFITEGDANGNISSSNVPTPRARRQLPSDSTLETQKGDQQQTIGETVQGKRPEIRRGAELWALLAGGNLNAQLFAANSNTGNGNPAPLPFWNNNDSSDSDDSSSDESEVDESGDPFVSSDRGRGQNLDRLASDMWMPEKKKGTSLNRLLRVLQKRPVFNEVQGHSNALAELRQIRPDVGGLDSRGEIIPIQYLGSRTSAASAATSVPISVISQGSPSLSEKDPLAIAHKASLASKRKFDGPTFSHISKRSWKDIRASRIFFYLKRILLQQGQSVVLPAPVPARHASVSSAGFIERLVGCIHACFQRCCSRPVSAEEATLQRWKNGLLRDDLIDIGFGLRPVQTPLLSSQLMARLGVITTFCCSDKNTVCESEPTVENVMLLKGQTGSVFIDLHADETSPTGIRFDDKNWKNHIAALKPVGLACLVNTRQVDSKTAASGTWKTTAQKGPSVLDSASKPSLDFESEASANVSNPIEVNPTSRPIEVETLPSKDHNIVEDTIKPSVVADTVPPQNCERRSRRLHTRRQLAVSGESVRPDSPDGDSTLSKSKSSQRFNSRRQSQVKNSKSRRSRLKRKTSDDLSGSGSERQDQNGRNRGGSFADEQRKSRKKRHDSNTSHEDMMTRKMHSRARSASGSEASSDRSHVHRGQSSPNRRKDSESAQEDGNNDNEDAQSVQSDYSMGRNEAGRDSAIGGTPTFEVRNRFRRSSRENSRDNDDSGFGSGFDDSNDSTTESDIDDKSVSGYQSRNMSIDGGASDDGKERTLRRSRRGHTKGSGGRESSSSSRLGSVHNRSAAASIYSSDGDSDNFGEEEGFSDHDEKSADRISDDQRDDTLLEHDTSASHTSPEQNKEDSDYDDEIDDEDLDEFDEDGDNDDEDEDDDEDDNNEDLDDEEEEEDDDEEEYGDDFIVTRSHRQRKVRLDVVKEEENLEEDDESDEEEDEDEEYDENEDEEEVEDGDKDKSSEVNHLTRSRSVPDRLDAKKTFSGDRSPSRVPRVVSDLDLKVHSEAKLKSELQFSTRKDDGVTPKSTVLLAPSLNLTSAIANAIRMPNLPSLASLGSLAFQPVRYSSPEGQRSTEASSLNASAPSTDSIVSIVSHTGQFKGGAQLVPVRAMKNIHASLSTTQSQNQRQQLLLRQQTMLLEQQNFLRRQRVVNALQQQILQRRTKAGAPMGPGKKIDVNKLLMILSKELAADDDRSLHKLAQAVKRVPTRSYLCSLAREIGFTEFDESQFQHVRHIHTIGVSSLPQRPPGHPASLGVPNRGPRVKPVRTIAHALQPAISATVVRDIRRNTLETLTQGNVPYLLSNCDMYWDGKDVLSFSKGRREALLSTFQQWQSEDLVCVGMAFDPVSREESEVLRLIESAYIQSTLSRAHAPDVSEQNTLFQPVDIGLGFDAANLFLMARDLKLNAQMDARRPASSPIALTDIEPSMNQSNAAAELVVEAPTPLSPISGIGETAAKKLAQMCEAKLLRMQSSQIFVGMVAARYLPQPKMQTLIKDLDGAGVRFTYMANRNYRQTKPLATKMGLETGWNCAISLMPRKQRRNRLIDGGEIASSQGAVEHLGGAGGEEAAGGGGQGGLGDFEVEDEDELEFGVEGILTEEQRKRRIRGEIDEQRWDMKAQLPHGIPEIRTHLKEKDNVPLLVSLFTDSTPASIAGMIRIMQENGEQVLVVCSSLRKSTPLLFNVADLGVAIEPPFDGLQRDSVSDRKGVNVKTVSLSQIADAAGLTLNGGTGEDKPTSSSSSTSVEALPLNPQHPNLRFSSAFTSLHASLSLPAGASLHLLLKTITESRRILEEARQTLLFVSASQVLLGLVIVVNICTAMPQVLPIHHLLWLSWVIIPLVALPLLAAPPNDVKHGSNDSLDTSGGDLISMPAKRPLTAKAKDGTMHVWDILPGPEAPSLTEQEAAHLASQEPILHSESEPRGNTGIILDSMGTESDAIAIAVVHHTDDNNQHDPAFSIQAEDVRVQVDTEGQEAIISSELNDDLGSGLFDNRQDVLTDVSHRGDQQSLRTTGTATREGLPFSEGVHTIEGIDELILNEAEIRNSDDGLHTDTREEFNNDHDRRRTESVSMQDNSASAVGVHPDDEVLLPVIFSADEEGGDDDVKHQLRLRSLEDEGLRLEGSAEDGLPSAAELELVLGLDKDVLSPTALEQGLLFGSPVVFYKTNGQDNEGENNLNKSRSADVDDVEQNDLGDLGIIDSDREIRVEGDTNEFMIPTSIETDNTIVNSALNECADPSIPVVESDNLVFDSVTGETSVRVRIGKAKVPKSVSKGPTKTGKRTVKNSTGTAQSQLSSAAISSSSASSSSSSSSSNIIPGFDAKTGGVRAEALIKYAAYNDVTSILSGNTLDLTDVSAKLTAVRLKNRGAQTGGALTAADAAAELDFAMGIPPVQGLVASSPPPTALPRSWRTLTLYAALSLLPAACIHEYLFERSLAVCFQKQEGGWVNDRDNGGNYPLFYPSNLLPEKLKIVKACISSAQSFVLLSLVIWFAVSSTLFAHRALSWWHNANPIKNKAWIIGCLSAFFLQLIYCHVLTAVEGSQSIFSTEPWDIWIADLVFQGVSFCILWLIRRHDAKQLQRERKMARLLFDTRLGMYSPR